MNASAIGLLGGVKTATASLGKKDLVGTAFAETFEQASAKDAVSTAPADSAKTGRGSATARRGSSSGSIVAAVKQGAAGAGARAAKTSQRGATVQQAVEVSSDPVVAGAAVKQAVVIGGGQEEAGSDEQVVTTVAAATVGRGTAVAQGVADAKESVAVAAAPAVVRQDVSRFVETPTHAVLDVSALDDGGKAFGGGEVSAGSARPVAVEVASVATSHATGLVRAEGAPTEIAVTGETAGKVAGIVPGDAKRVDAEQVAAEVSVQRLQIPVVAQPPVPASVVVAPRGLDGLGEKTADATVGVAAVISEASAATEVTTTKPVRVAQPPATADSLACAETANPENKPEGVAVPVVQPVGARLASVPVGQGTEVAGVPNRTAAPSEDEDHVSTGALDTRNVVVASAVSDVAVQAGAKAIDSGVAASDVKANQGSEPVSQGPSGVSLASIRGGNLAVAVRGLSPIHTLSGVVEAHSTLSPATVKATVKEADSEQVKVGIANGAKGETAQAATVDAGAVIGAVVPQSVLLAESAVPVADAAPAASVTSLTSVTPLAAQGSLSVVGGPSNGVETIARSVPVNLSQKIVTEPVAYAPGVLKTEAAGDGLVARPAVQVVAREAAVTKAADEGSDGASTVVSLSAENIVAVQTPLGHEGLAGRNTANRVGKDREVSGGSAKERKAVAAEANPTTAVAVQGATVAPAAATALGKPAPGEHRSSSGEGSVAAAVSAASVGNVEAVVPQVHGVQTVVPSAPLPGVAGASSGVAVAEGTSGNGTLSHTGVAGAETLVSPLAHTTLQATPTVLEVGVPGGTHGWLKIRAEIGEGGAVQASMSATTHAGQETLRRELPAINAFLDSERVSVSVQVAHGLAGASGSSLPDGKDGGFNLGSGMAQNADSSGSGAGRGETGQSVLAGDDSAGQRSGRQDGSSAESSSTTDSGARAEQQAGRVRASDWETSSGYGTGSVAHGGSWLNVMA